MREDFEITVPQVDLAVSAAVAAGAHGARMTGGGFIIALVDRDETSRIVAVASAYAAYAEAGYRTPRAFTTAAHDGARKL